MVQMKLRFQETVCYLTKTAIIVITEYLLIHLIQAEELCKPLKRVKTQSEESLTQH